MGEERGGETIPVLAAVVRREGRYLVARRPREKRHGGLWEFPGGKVSPGESLLQAAARELREELGVSVTGVGGILFQAMDPGSPFLIQFVDVRVRGEPRALEHLEVGWFPPLELRELPLAPTDARFVREWIGGREEGRKAGRP